MSIWDLFNDYRASDFFDPDEIDKIEADAARINAEYDSLLERKMAEVDQRIEEINRRFDAERRQSQTNLDRELRRIDEEHDRTIARINARAEASRRQYAIVDANQFSPTGVNWKKEGF